MPLQDNDRYLTWNQYSVTRREHDLVGNIGLGQRWRVGGWLLGYNSFYDKVLSESRARQRWRRSVGEYLRLSATITIRWATGSYAIIRLRSSGWPQGMTSPPARLPFYQHINTSVSVEQYFGDSVDLFTPAPATIIRWPSPLGSTPRSRWSR